MSQTTYRLEIELRVDKKVVHVERVEDADLVDVICELWWNAFANLGRLDENRLGIDWKIRPIFHVGSDRYCDAFELECVGADDGHHAVRCTVHALRRVADRAATRLVAEKVFTSETVYVYSLVATAAPARREVVARDAGFSASPPRATPLTWDVVPHRLLLEGAERIGGPGDEADEEPTAAFITREALERAERVARLGMELPGSIETGGVLVGPIASCPETGRASVVVTDVIEARDAMGTATSLTFTPEVWRKIRNVERAMQSAPETRSHRILGQVHGHNHMPPGGPPCELCHTLEVCTRTSAYLSDADETWCAAVFRAQPWQLSMVCGLNARAENVRAFYTQLGGRLQPSSFHLIPEYDPTSLATRS